MELFPAFECTPEDAASIRHFLRGVAAEEISDHGTPFVGNSTLDKDAKRAQVGAAMWECCELDDVSSKLRTCEELQRGFWGSSSTRWPYRYGPEMACLIPDPPLELRFLQYYTPRDHSVHQAAMAYAIEKVMGLYPRWQPRLRVIPLEDAAVLLRDDTSSGYPRMVGSPENLHYSYLEAFRLQECGYPLSEASYYPNVATLRTSAQGPYKRAKPRALSITSMVIRILEKMFQVPVQRMLRHTVALASYEGQARVNSEMTTMFQSLPDEWKVSVDYTQFDCKCPFEVIDAVFFILEHWCESNAVPLVRFCCEAFKRSGHYLPFDVYRDGSERTGGVPSGSVNTNLVDSLGNLICFHYACFRHGNGAYVKWATVCGDDAVVVLHNVADFKSIARIMFDELGMVIKFTPDKSMVSRDEVVFLQMHHDMDWLHTHGSVPGVRPVSRAFIGMTGHERPPARKRSREGDPWKGLYNTFRWLMQIEPCSYHPKFEQICSWYAMLDEDILRVLDMIVRGDSEVSVASSVLNASEGPGVVSLRSFRKSLVVSELCRQLGVVF